VEESIRLIAAKRAKDTSDVRLASKELT
jgi:hypothetical protein